MNSRLSGPAAWLLLLMTVAMVIFILAPLLVTVAISISDTPYVVFPPKEELPFSYSYPWPRFFS